MYESRKEELLQTRKLRVLCLSRDDRRAAESGPCDEKRISGEGPPSNDLRTRAGHPPRLLHLSTKHCTALWHRLEGRDIACPFCDSVLPHRYTPGR